MYIILYNMYLELGLLIEQWDRIDCSTTPTLIKISTNKAIDKIF